MNRTAHAIPTVGDVMTTVPITIGSGQTIGEAWTMIEEHGVRHLPVTNIEGKLLGIVSERDLRIVYAIAADAANRMVVDEIMVTEPYVVAPDASVSRVARAMASNKHGSAIVVDAGRIVGVFTSTDALHALADVAEGKAPRPQALDDAERQPPRGKTRRVARGTAAV